MPRYLSDVFFCPIAFGDVFVSTHPAAADHRLMAYGDHPPVGELSVQLRLVVFDQTLLEIGEHLLGIDPGAVNAVGDRLRRISSINGVPGRASSKVRP